MANRIYAVLIGVLVIIGILKDNFNGSNTNPPKNE